MYGQYYSFYEQYYSLNDEKIRTKDHRKIVDQFSSKNDKTGLTIWGKKQEQVFAQWLSEQSIYICEL
jgi:hypothetical protein